MRSGAEGRRDGYTAAIVVNAIMLYGAHHLLEWGVPFLTPAFNDVLWAISLSIGATMLANALFLAYDPAWFRHLAQIGLDGLALVSMYTLYRVFPFDFDAVWFTDLFSIMLLFTMFAIAIALVVQVVRMLTDPRLVAGGGDIGLTLEP